MSRAIMLVLLVTFFYSCSDISSNDGSATEVGNPIVIASCITSDSSQAAGAILTIAPKEYNTLTSSSGELRRLIIDESGNCRIEDLSQGEYTLTVYLQDSSEAVIHTITLTDTTEITLQTGTLCSFVLTVDNQSTPVTLYVPGTDIVKTTTPNNGEILWENFPAGMVPGIAQQEGSNSKTVVSSFSTSSETQAALIATYDWYKVIKTKVDLDKYNFSGVYDITTMSTGRLWMCVGNGIYYNNYAPDLGQWAVYQTENMPVTSLTKLFNTSTSESNVIWFSGCGNIVRYQQGWSYYEPPADSLSEKSVTAMTVHNEALYLAYGKEFFCLSNNTYEQIQLGISHSGNAVITSASVVDSTMYLSSSKDGIIQWQLNTQSWKQIRPSDVGLTSDSVRTLSVANNGDVWAISGAGLLHLSDGLFTLLADWSGQNDTLVDLTIDSKGNLWILGSTMLYKYEQGKVTTYVAKDLQFTSLTLDSERGILYLGHNEGLISKSL